jgi:error-prone DNA polymerase
MTASGVVFVTMEDETGFINLVLWAKVFDRLRHVATTSSLLMAHGKIERSSTTTGTEDVVYIVVQRLERLRMNAAYAPVPSMSRDFH